MTSLVCPTNIGARARVYIVKMYVGHPSFHPPCFRPLVCQEHVYTTSSYGTSITSLKGVQNRTPWDVVRFMGSRKLGSYP